MLLICLKVKPTRLNSLAYCAFKTSCSVANHVPKIPARFSLLLVHTTIDGWWLLLKVCYLTSVFTFSKNSSYTG